jgi:DNA replication and repair protein RecF
MRIQSLNLIDFRSFASLRSEFPDGVNWLVGPNAAGKTNLIEAIYYLSLARSFKKAADSELIRIGSAEAQILLKYHSEIDGDHVLEAHLIPQGKVIIFDAQKEPSVNKILGKLLCLVYSPSSVSLFRGEPAERRRFLDANLSLISDKYLYALSRQKKLLKERNTALAQDYDEDVIKVLTKELVNISYRIWFERKAFIQKIGALITPIYDRLFLSSDQVRLSYKTDMPDDDAEEAFVKDFGQRFDQLKSEERIRRMTLLGAQKDDLEAEIDGKEVFAYASQGQNRLLVLALTIAVSQIIEEHYKEKPVLLLDDVMSDLDGDRKKALLAYLQDRGQTFITSAENPEEDKKATVFEIRNQKIERRI